MSTTTDRHLTRVHRARWASVLTAMAAATAVAALADPVLGVDLAVRLDGAGVQQVGNLAVTVTSLLAGFAGWAALALLERWTGHARRVWTVLACGVLVASLTGPLAAVSPAATAVLLGLHLLVGAVLLVGLRRSARVIGS